VFVDEVRRVPGFRVIVISVVIVARPRFVVPLQVLMCVLETVVKNTHNYALPGDIFLPHRFNVDIKALETWIW